MQNKRFGKHIARVLVFCFLFGSVFCGTSAVSNADGGVSISGSDVKLTENCTADVNGGALVVTDTDDNNDVWSSKFLADAGMELTPGEQYKLSFSLAGEYGVGEFFLCKSENIDDRYDVTFCAEEGSRSISFTAEGNKVYIGMQVGNLGKGHSVTAEISGLCKLSESDSPALLRTENCSVSIGDGVIVATDTGENNDVWNSKLLYDAGITLEIGKTYRLSFSLEGDNGVGEFFICKSPDLNDRYDSTFVNRAGSKTVTFRAESDRLYIGMQFGNLGKGNSVTASIAEAVETAPAAPKQEEAPGDPNAVNCSYTVNGNVITVTDLGSNNDVWDSKLLYDAGIELEVGKQYEITFTISGDNGVGEFFLCKSMDINDRYDETFTSAAGERTIVFTAQGTRAYIGMQVGNVGQGNSVTLTVTEIKEHVEEPQTGPRVISAENCSYQVQSAGSNTVIKATDTSDDPSVWNSKILYYMGAILEQGRIYAANVNLSGENGVGEFLFLNAANFDVPYRYAFFDTSGDHTATFQAANNDLYAGMQFGNIGNGNDVTYTLGDVFCIPGLQISSAACSQTFAQDAITITDTGNNDVDVWDSKAVYNTGIVLEPGVTYSATFTLSGDNGVGEFFFLRSEDINNRYNNTFTTASGEQTVYIVSESGGVLYFGIQCGTIGNGNSLTLSNVSITPVRSVADSAAQPLMAMAAPESLPSEEDGAEAEGFDGAGAEDGAVTDPTEEPTEETEPETEPTEEPTEEAEPETEPITEPAPSVDENATDPVEEPGEDTPAAAEGE